MTKPHHGRIEKWAKFPWFGHPGEWFVVGNFLDHPRIKGQGHTSANVHHDEASGEIETLNSKYTLVGAEVRLE